MFKIGDKVVAVKEGKHLLGHQFKAIEGKIRVVNHVGGEAGFVEIPYEGLIQTVQQEGEPYSLGPWWCSADCFELADGKKKRGKRVPKERAIIPKAKLEVKQMPLIFNDAKVGMKVKCVEGWLGRVKLVKGKTYTISHLNNMVKTVNLKEIPDGAAWNCDRFTRAIEVKAKPKVIKEKKLNKFDVGDRVKVLPIHLEYGDYPAFGVIGVDGEKKCAGNIYTIKSIETGWHNKNCVHVGYRFVEKEDGFQVYTWDERYLKRVRKAVADKPKVKAPKAPIPSTVENSPVGTKLIAIAAWPYEGRDAKHYEIGDVFTVKEGFQTNEIVWITGEKKDGGYYRKDFVLYNPKKPAKELVPKRQSPPVMERVPLTRENAVVGMEVICIDQKPGIINGNKYKIKYIGPECLVVEGCDKQFFYQRFVFEQPVAKKKKDAIIPQEPPKAQHIHNDLLKGLAKKADGGAGTCSYAIKYADGYIDYHVQDACHRRIGGRGNQNGYGEPKLKHGQRIALALNIKGHLGQVKDKKDTYLRYVNYIISQSPHRDSFLTKGVDNALKNGILMDTKWCVERLAGGAVALREGSEYREKLKLFGELLDAGYSGHVAYTLSYGFTQDYKYSGISDAHASISGMMSANSYFKFFKEGYPDNTNKRVAFNKSDKCYEGICGFLDWKLPGQSINNFLREETAIKGDMDGGWDAPKAISVEDRKAKLYALADKLELLLY